MHSPDDNLSAPNLTASLRVATWNLYIGTGLAPVYRARSLAELPAIVSALWREVEASEVTARMDAVAEELAHAAPDVVALQEAARYAAEPLDAAGAAGVSLDFVELLLAALARRGLRYRCAASQENVDLALPDASGHLIRFTDRDVILAREGLETLATTSGHFATVVQHEADGVVFSLPRGWVAVEVPFAGEQLWVVNTHLENAGFPEVQWAQARELAALVAPRAPGTVLLGDLNSSGDGDWGTSYRALLGAGLTDAWTAAATHDPGATCCFSSDLRSGSLGWRIDVILHGSGLYATHADRLGAEPARRTPSGRRPSDHAGVAASLAFVRR